MGNSASVVIEVVGRSGIGKSSIITARIPQLKGLNQVELLTHRHGYDWRWVCTSLGIKLWICANIGFRLRPYLYKGITDIMRGVQLMSLTAREARKRHADAQVVVLDELGLFHIIQRFGVRATAKSIDFSWLTRTSWFRQRLPDILLICHGDEPQRKIRRASRGSRYDIVESANGHVSGILERNWPRVEREIARLAEDFEHRRLLQVVHVNVDKSLDDDMATLEAAIRSMLGSARDGK